MPCPFQWLVITDGTTNDAGIRNQVDLLSPTGFCLLEDGDWEPAISEPKGGGVWKDGQLADGRRLADFKMQNVVESMTLTVSALDQDALIRDVQELRRLLTKARTYGTTLWQTEAVWIEAQSPGESELRYSVIRDFRTPNDGNPYEEPFFQTIARAGMDDFTLTLEREPYWLADQPGTGTALEIGVEQTYNGINLGNVDSTGTLDPTTADDVYIANKHNVANITHIFTWSAANGFSANLMAAGLPYALLDIAGAAPAINDYVVFGINTAVADSGPFCSLVFDIGTAVSGIIVNDWEYSTGVPGWANLAAEQDNTNDDGAATGSAFNTTGVRSVHWEQPSAWATQAENGITGYWVRVVISAVPGAHVAPTQQNRDVYSITWPYVDLAATETGGDVPMLLRLRARNQSDDNWAGGAPQLYSFRVLAGERSLSRGSNFTPYLNCSNEQNPAGVTVTLFGAASFTANVTTPTGIVVEYLNVPASQQICLITIANTLSPEYYGTYHVFLRASQTGGAAGDVSLQVQWQVGSPFNVGTFPAVAFDTVSFNPLLLDIGQFSITPELPGDVLDFLAFAITGLGDGAADVQLLELILFPVDEWSGDFSGNMPLGFRGEVADGAHLRVDSLEPKRQIASTIRRQSTDYIADYYLSVTPGASVLQANAAQRMWFLQTWASSASFHSKPEISNSIQLVATKRYFSMRGNR